MTDSDDLQKATFGGGCFWCTEAVFLQLTGVESVVSGYAGGEQPNPTYQAVCAGQTGHAEVIQVTFDSSLISFTELLEVFFKTHDPTTLNRQGNDTGTQYRSVVFHHDDEQREITERVISELKQSNAFADPIVTEVSPLTEFFPAEGYHQNYYQLNSAQPYCSFVIAPKLDKLNSAFGDKLKSQS